jgi:hypothetical protein
MLIKDEAQLAKDKFFSAVDDDNERIAQSLRQYDGAVLIGKSDDPTDIYARMGKSLSALELKTKLEKLSPYIIVEKHPWKPEMWVVYSNTVEGKKYVSAYEDGTVPERTLMDTKTTLDVDPASLSPSWKPEKVAPELPNKNGIIEVDENAPRPGLRSYTNPWHIVKMGYRTILLRLVHAGVVSLARVELIFGNDNTPEWAAKTGKKDPTIARF